MEAFNGQEASPGSTLPPPPLSSAQQTAVEQQLADLRRSSGSEAALLVHNSGAMRAMDCLETNLEAGPLCQAVMDAQRSIAQALAQTLHNEASVQQSYYGTATYSVCIYRLNSAHAIVTIFGPTIREGHVWYYMREAAEALDEALTTEPEATPARRSRILGDGASMVEQYFANLSARRSRNQEGTTPGTRPRRGRRAGRAARADQSFPSLAPRQARRLQSGSIAPPAEPTPEPSTAPDAPSPPDPAPRSAPPVALADPHMPEPDPLPLDEIDWDVAADQDADTPAEQAWDALMASADTGFGGLGLDEAKKRGLIDDLQAQADNAKRTDAP
jgi:predicted regulator of Ras-like GTPase activity (Roadblock/LC7/MglB family)